MVAPYDRTKAMMRSASLAKGSRLSEFYTICEFQDSIATKKLLEWVRVLHDHHKDDAVLIRSLCDHIQHLEDQLRNPRDTVGGEYWG